MASDGLNLNHKNERATLSEQNDNGDISISQTPLTKPYTSSKNSASRSDKVLEDDSNATQIRLVNESDNLAKNPYQAVQEEKQVEDKVKTDTSQEEQQGDCRQSDQSFHSNTTDVEFLQYVHRRADIPESWTQQDRFNYGIQALEAYKCRKKGTVVTSTLEQYHSQIEEWRKTSEEMEKWLENLSKA